MPFLQSDEQSFLNIAKIVNEESVFNSTDKYFVINRIVNSKLRERIIDFLESNNQEYFEIKFDFSEFKKIGYSFSNIPDPLIWFSDLDIWERLVANTELREAKNRYLMNNNGARNFALEHGKKNHTWVMPWDGNCFMSDSDFKNLKFAFDISGNSYKYIATPMERVIDNATITKNTVSNNHVEEPQVSFRFDSVELFNEERVYGNQPKVEFFKKVGFTGKWDEWNKLSPWVDLKYKKSDDFGLITTASAVFRLASGNLQATTKDASRNIIRKQGICDFIDQVEAQYVIENLKSINYKTEFPTFIKNFIINKNYKEYNNKLIWAFSQDNLSEKNKKITESIIKELYASFNLSDTALNKVQLSAILFTHKFIHDGNLPINNKVSLIVSGQIQKIYNKVNSTFAHKT